MHRFASLPFKSCLPTLTRSVDGVHRHLASYIPLGNPGVLSAFNANKRKWNHRCPQNTTVSLFCIASGKINPLAFP